jgi:hypothetical protein
MIVVTDGRDIVE